MSELLKQVRVIDPIADTDRAADVLIVDGTLEAIADEIVDYPEGTEIVEARGLVFGPGLIDLYGRSGEPGFEHRETLDSLRRSALAGGFTRLTILPETDPPVDNGAILSQLQQTPPLPNSPSPHLDFWGALTVGLAGTQMTELRELDAAGAVGFADGRPLQNLTLLFRILEYNRTVNKIVALWPCDTKLVAGGVARESVKSVRLGLPGDPALSETTALAALLECVAATGTPVHIMRVSVARSLELIREAKARGLPVTASTPWTHVLLDDDRLDSYDPNLRLAPPIGTRTDRMALLSGIQDGTIDAIAIDGTPYSYEEKTLAFADAPPGAIGLELALPLLWNHLVESGELSAAHLWRLLSTHPARCLDRDPPTIAPPQPAEAILFAPRQMWTVERNTLRSRSANTPWLGRSISGRVRRVWCGGAAP